MLDTMHFADEINEGDKLDIPTENAKVNVANWRWRRADWDDEWKVQSR